MNRRLLLALSVVALLLVACSGGAGAGGEDQESSAGGGEEAAVEPADTALQSRSSRAAVGGSTGMTGDDGSSADSAAEDPVAADETTADAALSAALAVPPDDKVIKEGTIRLEVAEDSFDQAISDVAEAAGALGGSVVAMSTSSKEGEPPSGSVTVRVPVAEYDALISDVDGIGTVRDRSISSKDVTTEYVDLQARLRHAEAQERFYLGLLQRAVDVQDAIAVQQQVDGLQTEIERLRGRIRFLDSRTAFSTLTVELFEPGAPRVLTRPQTDPSLARYWSTARAAFVTVVGSVLVTAVSLAPLLVLLALGYVLWRALRARAVPPPASAAE